jgi:hypothetical protein
MVGHQSIHASQKIGLSKCGLEVDRGGAIDDIVRVSVRIRKGSPTERVHQLGRASGSEKDAERGNTPPTAAA